MIAKISSASCIEKTLQFNVCQKGMSKNQPNLSSLKLTPYMLKDAVPEGLRTRVVYKFSCASCNACYVVETSRHFSTRVREHLLSDRSSNVFKHLQSSEFCRASCTPDCFEILDSAATKYQVKLKESMFIKWEKPDLNQQVKHINLTLSL